ncbi:MAG: methylated-DNA--[protein]-cysteine S-methyltransferase [Leptonema sp. (in: bacteria)]
MIYYYKFDFLCLKLTIIENFDQYWITKLEILENYKGRNRLCNPKGIRFIDSINNFFDAYFYDKKTIKTPNFLLTGTDFQTKVWNYLTKIPIGQTISYEELAKSAGFSKNYARATGFACKKNPIPIIIPCHRVIGKKQDIKNYNYGIKIKKWLLEHEGSIYKN